MTIIQTSKLLLKNIDEEISLVIQKEKQFSIDSFIRGYHAYIEKWTAKVGDGSVCLKCEDGKEHNKYAAAVMIGGRIGSHVPKNVSKVFNLFLTLPNCAIKCKFTRKYIYRGAGYILEIPVQYNFFGPDKAVDWADKGVKEVIDSAGKKLRIVPSNNLIENICILLT